MGRVGGALIEDEKRADQRSRDQDHPRGCPPSRRGPERDHDSAGGKEPESRRMGRDRHAEEEPAARTSPRASLRSSARIAARPRRSQTARESSFPRATPPRRNRKERRIVGARREAADPAACDRKERAAQTRDRDDRGEAIGKVGADAEDLEHRLVGHHRQGDQVQVQWRITCQRWFRSGAGRRRDRPPPSPGPAPVDQHADGATHRHGENRRARLPDFGPRPFPRTAAEAIASAAGEGALCPPCAQASRILKVAASRHEGVAHPGSACAEEEHRREQRDRDVRSRTTRWRRRWGRGRGSRAR